MKKFNSVEDILISGKTLSASIDYFIDKALAYKQNPWKDQPIGYRKRLGLVFMNPSLRTRISTQIAAEQLGMQPIVLNVGTEGWSWELEEGTVMKGSSVEHIKDAVPVLSSYFDILAVRTFPGLMDREADYAEKVLNAFIQYATVPVVSLESATLHPLQSLADLVTIKELAPKKPKVVLCWAPHIKSLPQCVANSFAQWANAWEETQLTIAHPPGYALADQFVRQAQVYTHKQEALKDADIIYLKNWSAYEDYGSMPPVAENWILGPEDLQWTNNARIMHCLPVRRNVEVRDFLLDGASSIVTEQAANRVWAAQAVLAELIKSNYGTA